MCTASAWLRDTTDMPQAITSAALDKPEPNRTLNITRPSPIAFIRALFERLSTLVCISPTHTTNRFWRFYQFFSIHASQADTHALALSKTIGRFHLFDWWLMACWKIHHEQICPAGHHIESMINNATSDQHGTSTNRFNIAKIPSDDQPDPQLELRQHFLSSYLPSIPALHTSG